MVKKNIRSITRTKWYVKNKPDHKFTNLRKNKTKRKRRIKKE